MVQVSNLPEEVEKARANGFFALFFLMLREWLFKKREESSEEIGGSE